MKIVLRKKFRVKNNKLGGGRILVEERNNMWLGKGCGLKSTWKLLKDLNKVS